MLIREKPSCAGRKYFSSIVSSPSNGTVEAVHDANQGLGDEGRRIANTRSHD